MKPGLFRRLIVLWVIIKWHLKHNDGVLSKKTFWIWLVSYSESFPLKKLKQKDQTWIHWPKQRGSHDAVMADRFPFCSSARTGDWSANKHLPLMNTEAYKPLPQSQSFLPLVLATVIKTRGFDEISCLCKRSFLTTDHICLLFKPKTSGPVLQEEVWICRQRSCDAKHALIFTFQ